MKKRFYIHAAQEEDERVNDLSNILKDDFNFALDGFDRLAREGKVSEALDIMSILRDAINVAIEDSAAEMV